MYYRDMKKTNDRKIHELKALLDAVIVDEKLVQQAETE
jgi:hypothetical protein